MSLTGSAPLLFAPVDASALAAPPAAPAPRLPAPDRARIGDLALGGLRPPGGLQELERLHIDQVLVLAGDVGVAHRRQELLRSIEVVNADPDAAQPLRDMAVGAGAGNDPVLAGKPLRLLVECGQRDPGVEDLEDVDLID